MKRCGDISAIVNLADSGKFILKIILAILLLVHIGHVTAVAQQVTNEHETTTSGSDAAAPDQQRRKIHADQSVAALVDLLKKKNVISADEASVFIEQTVSGDVVSDQSMAALVDLLKSKNVITADEAAGLAGQAVARRDSERAAVIASEKDQKERFEELNQRVSHVTQKVAELYSGKVAELAAAAPEWTKRIRYGGDVRLRYENDRFNENNFLITKLAQGTETNALQNSWADQEPFKYRVRAGVEIDIAENEAGNAQMQAAVRLATGNTSNPVSTNTLLGDYMNKDNIVLDQAYFKFSWKTLDNLPTIYTVYGGRMPNPWFSTDLVWDTDLNFEGLALNAKKPLTESWTSYLTAGVFPLQQSEPADTFDFSQHKKWLYGGQAALEKKDRRGISSKFGAAYYHFSNITGVRNDDPFNAGVTDWSAPLFQQRGNTLFYIDPTFFNSAPGASNKVGLASEFKELNLTGTFDVGFWDPVHIILLGDYVKNFGFNQSKVNALTGDLDTDKAGFQAAAKETTGYQLGMSIGRPAIETFDKWKAPWKVFLYYKYLEADAVVDAFTDSDFHLGGTNTKGWILGTEFGLMKNTWLTLRWLTADEIEGPPLAIDVFQVDLNASY